ncbi:MAG: YihA family ribosome biogenesis GTP-binding protein [Clostridia bacterium]|nr:YihA family ribosome biogenesis GTP-binding protein [Clostridia bacterium]
MQIKKAEFVTSVANASRVGEFDKPEIALVGRSNVGKSSLINAMCNRQKLAKTSATPGRTRLVNYFVINNEFHLVDLPGYGYALASKKEQAEWQDLIGGYLENSPNLRHVFVLVDIRHEPNQNDQLMLKYLYTYQIPFSIIATKLDKLKPSQVSKQIQILANTLGVGTADILAVSSEKKANIDKLLAKLDEILA